MRKWNKPVWKIAAESFLAAVAASALLTGYQWLLAEAGMISGTRLGLALMGGAYLVLFLFLFYYLFRQRALVVEAQREKEEASLRDETTKLYKSRIFKEMAGRQIRLCKRNDWPVGMVILDIDRLGAINEKYGYEAGNRVLAHFARTLEATVRESDLISRLDDDRFALLLPNCEAKDAKKVVQRFQSEILSRPLKADRGEVKIPFSCGIVSFSGKIAKYNQLAGRAREALERAKSKGGNRIELY